ncbi:MAG: hypothetical protein ABIA91_03240 [Patescibacteria group bacterium]
MGRKKSTRKSTGKAKSKRQRKENIYKTEKEIDNVMGGKKTKQGKGRDKFLLRDDGYNYIDKTQFTKDELYEIEKHFDYLAGVHVYNSGDVITNLFNLINKKKQKELINDFTETYDLFRTISAKCKMMREQHD